jgi:hypothetical protein
MKFWGERKAEVAKRRADVLAAHCREYTPYLPILAAVGRITGE